MKWQDEDLVFESGGSQWTYDEKIGVRSLNSISLTNLAISQYRLANAELSKMFARIELRHFFGKEDSA